ncbi:MAG: NUDIX domain-containing protein [Candidatus Andersenbacteria bacterium]|nr:NUDIX domain-containing protein [Candidatus Andersenbacteria bacterium]MBI3251029.1 NUDIX domain-containing protein [Candidatus Andersenbacteria bacterium]
MAHIHNLIDFTVAIFIVHKNKVLLVDHKKLKSWLPIGGHIELHENPEEALIREIKEECGLEVELIGGNKPDIQDNEATPLLAPLYMDIHSANPPHQHIGLIYFGKSATNNVSLAAAEHHNFRWFTREDIKNSEYKILRLVRFYAKEALQKLSD